ncbi:MAG: tetratricopeptide repeat protein [Alphaproteobacteria bacterium]|nr:tetratricopeptide repeat protein [Alphaproteobacteria bacterium]
MPLFPGLMMVQAGFFSPCAAQEQVATPATIDQAKKNQEPLKDLGVKDEFPKEVEELGILPKLEPLPPSAPGAPSSPPQAAAAAPGTLSLPVPVELPPAPAAAAPSPVMLPGAKAEAPVPPLPLPPPPAAAAPVPVELPNLAPPSPPPAAAAAPAPVVLPPLPTPAPAPALPTLPAPVPATAAAPAPVALPELPAPTPPAPPVAAAVPTIPVPTSPVPTIPVPPPAPLLEKHPAPDHAKGAEPPAPLPEPVAVTPPPAEEKAQRGKKKNEGRKSGKPKKSRSQEVLNAIPSGTSSLPVPTPQPPLTIEHADPAATPLTTDPAQANAPSALGITVQNTQSNLSTPQLLEEAYQALLSNQAERAIAMYSQVITREPKNELALFGLATTYQRTGQRKRALGFYETLLTNYPNHIDGMNNYLLLMAEEEPAEAKRQMELLERRTPEFAPVLAQLGMLYYKDGNLQAAAKKLGKAISLEPENLIYRYNMAVVQDKLGNVPEAIKLYALCLDAGYKGAMLPDSLDKIQRRLTFLRSK